MMTRYTFYTFLGKHCIIQIQWKLQNRSFKMSHFSSKTTNPRYEDSRRIHHNPSDPSLYRKESISRETNSYNGKKTIYSNKPENGEWKIHSNVQDSTYIPQTSKMYHANTDGKRHYDYSGRKAERMVSDSKLHQTGQMKSGHVELHSLYGGNSGLVQVNAMNAPNDSTLQCGCENIDCPFCNLMTSVEMKQ